jgi:hypothetical protein
VATKTMTTDTWTRSEAAALWLPRMEADLEAVWRDKPRDPGSGVFLSDALPSGARVVFGITSLTPMGRRWYGVDYRIMLGHDLEFLYATIETRQVTTAGKWAQGWGFTTPEVTVYGPRDYGREREPHLSLSSGDAYPDNLEVFRGQLELGEILLDRLRHEGVEA